MDTEEQQQLSHFDDVSQQDDQVDQQDNQKITDQSYEDDTQNFQNVQAKQQYNTEVHNGKLENLQSNQYQSADHDTMSPAPTKKRTEATQEEFLSPATNTHTLVTENEQMMTASKFSKMSSRASLSSARKNFIADNKKVKTQQDVKQEFQAMRQRRNSLNSGRKELQWTELRKSIFNHGQSGPSRAQEWNSLNLRNNLIANSKTCQSGNKNQSKDFVVKHVVLTLDDLKAQGIPTNNKGGSFSKTMKEKSYHMTNSSSIPSLNSFKALDGPEVVECREFPTTKGNQQLKRAMNQSNVFEKTNSYLKDEQVPQEFNSHHASTSVVHNVNNVQVQSMRMKNYYSQVI